MYNFKEDITLIQPQYEKEFNTSFFHDSESLGFTVFYARISSLKGDFKEVISLRDKYMRGKSLTAEERIAVKEIVTDEQRKYVTWREDKKNAETLNTTANELIKSIL